MPKFNIFVLLVFSAFLLVLLNITVKKTLADFRFDFEPPQVALSLPYADSDCYTSALWPTDIQVLVDGTGSSVQQVFWRVVPAVPPGASPITAGVGTPTGSNGNWTIPATTLNMNIGTTYDLLVRGLDEAGNMGTFQTIFNDFTYSATCSRPWLRVKDGDVHSNDEIIAPGGP